MQAPQNGEADIGKLGKIAFAGGWYLYVGSAFGSGGVRARVRRHAHGSGKLHWHIDYLLRKTGVDEVWYAAEKQKTEEQWVQAIRNTGEGYNPLTGFGSGDCGCSGHLFHFNEKPDIEDFQNWLKNAVTEMPELKQVQGREEVKKVFE